MDWTARGSDPSPAASSVSRPHLCSVAGQMERLALLLTGLGRLKPVCLSVCLSAAKSTTMHEMRHSMISDFSASPDRLVLSLLVGLQGRGRRQRDIE